MKKKSYARKDIEKMTDEELIEEARELHETIFHIDCFGIKDLIRYEFVCGELDMRDYGVSTKLIIDKY